MAAMSESQFLIDMHKWAMQGHIDYIGEVNESANNLVGHINQYVRSQQQNDDATSGALKRVTGNSTRSA
jgi:hypothetical protein